MENSKQLTTGSESNLQEQITVEVLKEELRLEKEIIETGVVRVIKKVHANEESVAVDLSSTNIRIEKIPVNRIVEKAPGVRYEGDIMIVPVLKEVLVTEKKLMLVEEWHISQTVTTTEHQETISLQEEEVIIERIASQ